MELTRVDMIISAQFSFSVQQNDATTWNPKIIHEACINAQWGESSPHSPLILDGPIGNWR
jgi:hypothetical protein